jgi:hypothetical protein
MPFDKIHYLQLRYPRLFGACAGNLGHTGQHWLQDALYITQRFTNLKHLVLQTSYNTMLSLYHNDKDTWEPIFERGTTQPRKWTKRVTKVVKALAQINGNRMPACVKIHVDETIVEEADQCCVEALNVAIPLAFGKYIPISKYMALYPSWRDEVD